MAANVPERVRFTSFNLERLANGRCHAVVSLSLGEMGDFQGESEGLSSQAGELRCSAQACVEALARAVAGAVKLEVLGVKAVRAFDSTVVIVSLAVDTAEGARRLVGCCLTEQDTSRGAALAVLNATNRLLGNKVFLR